MADTGAQDPGETQGYSVDWTADLAVGETVSASAWAVTPAGPTISAQANTSTVATCDLAGVTLAAVYRLTNTITTSAARTLIGAIFIRAFPQ